MFGAKSMKLPSGGSMGGSGMSIPQLGNPNVSAGTSSLRGMYGVSNLKGLGSMGGLSDIGNKNISGVSTGGGQNSSPISGAGFKGLGASLTDRRANLSPRLAAVNRLVAKRQGGYSNG